MRLPAWLRRKHPAPVRKMPGRPEPDDEEPYASYQILRPRTRRSELPPRPECVTGWDVF